jgi:outer membrane lipoprotein LolB
MRPLAAASIAAASIAAVLLLAGCTLQRPVPPVDWQARTAQLAALESWQARGRIAVKSPDGGGQGDLLWRQEGESARIRVSGPFGAGAWEIRWDPALLTIAGRDGELTRAYTGPDAAEQFLTEQLGWSFPAMSVRYWLLGLPHPAFPAHETRGAAGELLELEQNGWNVRYQQYVRADGIPMPARLTAENELARLRLAVDRWCLAPTCD